MTLKDLIDVYGSGCYLHVGTESGEGWYWTGRTIHADEALSNWFARKVINIYDHEGRKGSISCCELKAGIAVIVEGSENGIY